jgi:hypothetical protein
MTRSTVLKFIDALQSSFARLGVQASLSQVEELAFLLHSSMVGERRKFHTAQHALFVGQADDPLEQLAGLFHDIIYLQVDGWFPPRARPLLPDVALLQNREVEFCFAPDTSDLLLSMCLDLFGLQSGRYPYSHPGLNEFLSALVAWRSLHQFLTLPQLLVIGATIEGTIPFRRVDAAGRTCSDRQEERLASVNAKYGLKLSGAQIQAIVHTSVNLANRDVTGFAVEDAAVFLDNTCMLLGESNRVFDESEVYSIREYRAALYGMESFFQVLNPKDVFRAYRGIPDAATHERLTRQATMNLSIAQEYLGMKLVSVALLEALASISGGDAPLSLFIGDPRNGDPDQTRFEDFLPDTDLTLSSPNSSPLGLILQPGQTLKCVYDMRTSPICSLLLSRAPASTCQQYLVWAKDMFADRLSPRDFLDRIDRPILGPVARACLHMAETRSAALKPYAA